MFDNERTGCKILIRRSTKIPAGCGCSKLSLLRTQVQLATKFGIDASGGSRSINGSPDFVRKAIKGSLERLQVPYVDLYYQHRIDPETPIEDTVRFERCSGLSQFLNVGTKGRKERGIELSAGISRVDLALRWHDLRYSGEVCNVETETVCSRGSKIVSLTGDSVCELHLWRTLCGLRSVKEISLGTDGASRAQSLTAIPYLPALLVHIRPGPALSDAYDQ